MNDTSRVLVAIALFAAKAVALCGCELFPGEKLGCRTDIDCLDGFHCLAGRCEQLVESERPPWEQTGWTHPSRDPERSRRHPIPGTGLGSGGPELRLQLGGTRALGLRMVDLNRDGRAELLVHGPEQTLVVGPSGVLSSFPATVGPGIVTDVDGDGAPEWVGACVDGGARGCEGNEPGVWVGAVDSDGRLWRSWRVPSAVGEALVAARLGGVLVLGTRSSIKPERSGVASIDLDTGEAAFEPAPGVRADRIAARIDRGRKEGWVVVPWFSVPADPLSPIPEEGLGIDGIHLAGWTLDLASRAPKLELRHAVEPSQLDFTLTQGSLTPSFPTSLDGPALLLAYGVPSTARVRGLTMEGRSGSLGPLWQSVLPEDDGAERCAPGQDPAVVHVAGPKGARLAAMGIARPLADPPPCAATHGSSVWLLDLGSGSVTASIADAGQPLAAADFDGDGRDELVTHHRDDGTVRIVALADGVDCPNGACRATFVGPIDPSLLDDRGRVAIGDMDGDGRLEVAIAAEAGIFVLQP